MDVQNPRTEITIVKKNRMHEKLDDKEIPILNHIQGEPMARNPQNTLVASNAAS